MIFAASGPSMDSGASIIRDNARLSAENSNLGRRTCGEKNWWQKSAAFEIVFVVARSRRGWNFNNYSVDFPGVPLDSFAKEKKETATSTLYIRFRRFMRRQFTLRSENLFGENKSRLKFYRLSGKMLNLHFSKNHLSHKIWRAEYHYRIFVQIVYLEREIRLLIKSSYSYIRK